MIKIVQKEEKVLHQKAKEVSKEDFGKPKLKKILKDMETALVSQGDGVAIAAPQIGVSLRIFLVSEKAFDENFVASRDERLSTEEPMEKPSKTKKVKDNLVYINPKITKLSRDKKWLSEGCLSVRWLYGKTHRSTKATIEALDENGKKFTRGASGLLAQIFQHETDHLNGILFIDHAKDVKEEKPAE